MESLVTFYLTVGAALISCVSAVVSVQNARKPPSLQLQSEVDEMGAVVEKLFKQLKSERASRVRSLSREVVDATGEIGNRGGSLHGIEAESSPTAINPMDRKRALRAKVRLQKGMM